MKQQRTSERRVVAGNKLSELIRKKRLQGRCLVEEQPARCQKHVVRVPRLHAIKQRISSVEGRAKRRVVGWVQRVDRVKHILRDCGRVDEIVLDERVECRVLLRGGNVQTPYGPAEEGPFVVLPVRR